MSTPSYDIDNLRAQVAALPRPDLEGARPSSEELQLWIGMAYTLLHLLASDMPPIA